MQPTAAPWAKPRQGDDDRPAAGAVQPPTGGRNGGGSADSTAHWVKAGDPGAPMAPTAAPWAKPGGVPLPPAVRGEATKAPWAPARGPALAGRSADAAVPGAQPRLPAVAADSWGSHAFLPATKRIHTADHLSQFLRSEAARDYVSFVLALSEAVRGRQLSDPCQESEAVRALVAALDVLCGWVDDIPPAAQSLRYGNPAFRTWFARLEQHAEQLIADVLPQHLKAAAVELRGYFVDSFGNTSRIDYGTGHETTFCALLYCLARLGVVGGGDAQALVLRVFARYLALMRKIQTTYWLEPAGSHGVWGLDDYHFLPFLWGASQLSDHPFIRPSSILHREVLEGYGGEYLYLGGVRFVQQVKRGPLQETSPMLVDISGVPSWSKVATGMARMYQAEVLAKLPIMQHFLFGSLIGWRPQGGGGEAPVAAVTAAQSPQDEDQR